MNVLHLGDHDPNGIDMTRDNRDRLNIFAGEPIEVRRIALNIDQVREYSPPPNFAKETDSRFKGYVRKYGSECWELDAPSPTAIETLIRDELLNFIDDSAWTTACARETRSRAVLRGVSTHWPKVEIIARAEGWL